MGMFTSEGRIVFNEFGKAVGLRNNDGTISFFADLTQEQLQQIEELLEGPVVAIYLGEVADETEMLALDATQGQYCYRTDTSSFWDCIDTDTSDEAGGWAQRGAGGGGSMGGASGDSITATTRTGGRLDTITVNGITWTYEYSGVTPVRLVAFDGKAYELSVDLTENAAEDYVEDPLGNTREDGGAIRCTTATAWALEAAAQAATIALKPGFTLTVTDCAYVIPVGGGSPVYGRAKWVWNGLYFDYDFEMRSLEVFTNSTVSGVTDLLTITAAKEFLNAPHKILAVPFFAEADVVGSPSGSTTFRILLNGGTSPYFYSAGGAASATNRRSWIGTKMLKYRGAAAQGAALAGAVEGYNEIPSEFTVNSATTNFAFTGRVTHGSTPMPFTLRDFAVRCTTRMR